MSSRGARTRQRVLDAAYDLLLVRGFRGTAMEDVAAAAGLTRQAVYFHFPSKSALFTALVDHVSAREKSDFNPLAQTRSAAEAVDTIIDFNAPYLQRIYAFARLIHAARREEPAAAAAWQHRMDDLRTRWGRVAQRLHAEGTLAEGWSVDEAATMLWTLAGFPVYEYLVVDAGWSLEHYRAALKQLVHAALYRDASTAADAASRGTGPRGRGIS